MRVFVSKSELGPTVQMSPRRTKPIPASSLPALASWSWSRHLRFRNPRRAMPPTPVAPAFVYIGQVDCVAEDHRLDELIAARMAEGLRLS
jgi:hypothetical protein